jgi:MFS family permease|tara:strand:+ start:1707 stop:2834 length:1128 start_codon:yes stop_codon:yes gene_type:complete
MNIVVFVADIVNGIFYPNLPIYANSIGTSIFLLSIIVASGGIANMMSHLYLGPLADIKGRKIVQIIGLILFISCPFITTLINSPQLLIIPYLLNGGGIILFSMAMAYIGDISKTSEIDKRMGILMVSQGLGLSIGPIIGGFIVSNYGFKPAFYLATMLGIIALMVAITIKEEPLNKIQTEKKPFWSTSKEILRDKVILSLSLIGILSMFAYRGVISFVPVYGIELGIAVGMLNIIIGIRTIFSTIARLPAGYLSARVKRKTLIFISVIFASISYLVLHFAETTEILLLGVILEGISFGIFLTVSRALIVATAKKSERTTTLGVFNAISYPGQTILLLGLGAVGQISDLRTVFLISSIIIAILGTVSSYALNRNSE